MQQLVNRRMMDSYNRLPVGYTRLESIQSTNNAFIDTGITGRNDFDVEGDFQCVNLDTSYPTVFGFREPSFSYYEVEYLQSSGSQYIDLDIEWGNTAEVWCTFEFTDLSPLINIFGSVGGTNPRPGLRVYHASDSTNLVVQSMAGKIISTDISINTIYNLYIKVEADGNWSVTFNDVTTSYTGASLAQSDTITLFRSRLGSSFNGGPPIKIYSFHIKTNNKELDMVPMSNGSTHGMWDKIGNKIYTSAGSGTFTVGDMTVPNKRLYFVTNASGTGVDSQMGNNGTPSGWGNIVLGNTKHNIIMSSSRGMILDGVVGRNDISWMPFNGTMYLFAQRTSATQTNIDSTLVFHGKIFRCKIRSEGDMIADFVPCKNPQNVLGMYDLVRKSFFSSPNGDVFV